VQPGNGGTGVLVRLAVSAEQPTWDAESQSPGTATGADKAETGEGGQPSQRCKSRG
jgi:hypothetical protein